MRRSRVKWLTILGVFLASPGWAQTKTGTTIGLFSTIEPSARISAMGNAGVAVPDLIQSIYYNTAALGELDRLAIQLTHSFWFADISLNYVALAWPAGNIGNFFGSVQTLDSGDMDVRTVEQPLGTGERYSVQDLALGIAYARQITDRFSAGAQMNYLSETIWHSKMHTVTFNFGTLYRLTTSGMMLGASLANFGTNGRFDGRDLEIQYDNDPSRHGDNSALPGSQLTQDFPVPILFRVGVSYPQRLTDSSQLLIVVDAQHPNDNSESLSAGWEWLWKDSFAVRAGYQNIDQKDSEVGLTAGVGLRGKWSESRFQFDYAWGYHTSLSETHRLTLVLGL